MTREALLERIAAAKRQPVATGPCTPLTSRCPSARDYRSELPACCRAHLVALMQAAAAALNKAGAVWWADYGTLMGAVRNPMTTWADYPWLPQAGRPAGPLAPGIVPHDKDADLGVTFRSLGSFQPPARVLVFKDSLKLELSVRNKTNVDLFLWHERPDGTLYRERYAAVDDFKGREFHRDLLFPLSTVEWEGMTLPAPRDPEAFLAMRYGPGWRTPLPANNDGIRRG